MSVPDRTLELPVVELAAKLEAGELTSLALVAGYLERVERRQDLNAFITVAAERAIAEAKQADAARAAGARGVLLGMPYGLKDLIDTQGIRTTWGTRGLLNRMPAEDADVQTRLRAAGAVLLGKLNLTELANGFGNREPSANHNGAIRNPWNPAWWAGGSSSGSGAAVAAGLCAFAIGTETFGSIDSPASLCGVAGLRPTYDVVSRRGVMPLAFTLDKVGVLARDARDIHPILDAIAQTPLAMPEREALRIGVVETKGKTLGPEFDEAWARAVEVIRGLGSVETLALDLDVSHRGAILTILLAERDVAFETFIRDGHVYELYDREPWDVKRRDDASTVRTAADYVKAMRLRTRVQREWQALFDRFDVIVCAGRAGPPALADRALPDGQYSVSHSRVLVDGNLAGLPAITIPMGFTQEHFPVSMHAVASPYEDHTLIAFAERYQQRTDWHRRRPG